MELYKDIEQGTKEWHDLRVGCITGTKLKGCKGNWNTEKGRQGRDTAIFTLIGEEFFPPVPIFENEAMLRGKVLEQFAREEFIKSTDKKVEEVGFIKNSKYSDEFSEDNGGWLGLSPDGVIYDENGVITEAFEAKCFLPTNFVRTFIKGEIPDENFDQALTYFLVIPTLQKFHFTIYNPDCFISENVLKVKTITREEIETELKETEAKLFEFRKLWIDNIKLFLNIKD